MNPSFESLIEEVAGVAVVDPDNLTTADRGFIVRSLAGELRRAFEAAWWPELMVCEQRFLRAPWQAAVYAAGTEVVHAGKYWVAETLGAGIGDEPGASAKWTEFTPTAELLYEGESWQSPIGTVRGIYASDPRENAQALRQVWGTWGAKIRLMGRPQCLTPWVVYRQELPVWSGATLGDAEVVAAGQVRYFSGDFWRCSVATEAGQTPATHPAKWQVQAVPSRCAVYAVRAVAAALLRRAAQYERGGAEEAAAKTWLGEEMAKAMVEPNYFNQ